MFMRMRIRRAALLFLLMLLCAALSGCRTRTTGIAPAAVPEGTETAAVPHSPQQGPAADDAETARREETGAEPSGQTRENPSADRKEYDESAPAEIVPGTEHAVHGEGEGSGAFSAGEETDAAADKLNEEAEITATQTVPAEKSDRMGTAEDAKEADSALTYYTVLLQDRMGSLFECQRLSVYWETPEDHVTIFRTSPEHALILNAGAYDVSARLLEENLHVDDGWIGRKNPGVIVKAVDRSILGTGAASTGAARQLYAELTAREGWQEIDAVRNGRILLLSEELLQAPHLQVAAMLLIAKTANPDVMADTDVEKALELLAEEAAGSIPAGIYFYTGP